MKRWSPEAFPLTIPSEPAPDCFGLGYKMEFDEDLMIPDKSLSIKDGAIVVLGWAVLREGGQLYPGDLGRAGEGIPL